MRGRTVWDMVVQVCLPLFTVLGFALVSFKMPAYGVAVSLFAQIFWLYSSYKSWKTAGQLGIFINTIILTMVFAYGVVNYWFL